MKRINYILFSLVLLFAISGKTYCAEGIGISVTVKSLPSKVATTSNEVAGISIVKDLSLNGTYQSAVLTISPVNLLSDEPITLTAPAGFTVMPTQIPSGSTSADVTVTYTSTLQRMTGDLILRSGDTRVYIPLTGIGTPLVRKNIALNPKFTGTGDVESFSADKAAGFNPADKGYTLEFKVSTNNLNKDFTPYAITENGVGFQSLVNSGGMSMYNSLTTSGLATQYNNDKAHIYRYAVTPDNRVFIYRDGIAVDTVRAADYGLQTSFVAAAGDPQENLLKNSGFEGEHNEGGWPGDLSMTTAIEGWMISPMDGYNSTQKIVKQEIDNVQDLNNHAINVDRYMWNDGYGAAEISQIVDVAPNEVYSLSTLAKGGIKSDGTKLGSIKIQEVQNTALGLSTPVTSAQFQTYSMDYTTSANCKQLKVVLYLERDKWGASISSLVVDNVKLMGKGMTHKQAVGFTNKFSNVEYFTYDVTGAYAPAQPAITPSVSSLALDGTNKSQTFSISPVNLLSDEPITLTAPAGFTVMPTQIPSGSTSADVTVTYTSTLQRMTGDLILRSGDTRVYIPLTGIGTPLVRKNIALNPKFTGTGDVESFSADKAAGFNPTDKGYTLEFKVSTNNLNKDFTPYAITENGVGFQSLVNSGGMSIFNSVTTSSLATQYNNDKAHIYRYAVTPDNRVFIYRDGIAVDTVRAADYGLQTSFVAAAGDPQENLLKNSGFEGEHNEGGWPGDLSMTTAIEGWMISPMDGYNSTQKIVKQEIDNVQDLNNHAINVDRYMWNDGYGAAEISQIVDVAPNEVYSLSTLAKGGIKSDGTKLGSIKIQEVQNTALGLSTPVTSAQFQTYSMDYTTSANCKQLKVVLYLERDKWGASISSLVVDNVKLMGKGMTHKQAVGFTNKFSNVEYFTYDVTGAYAPAQPAITPSVSSLALDGTNKSQTFSISPVNLLSDEPITLTAPAGFTVMPTQIPSGSTSADVTVTYTSTLQRMTGDLILRSGDTRVYIPLTGIGTPLVRKNIALNPKFTGTGDVESFSADKAAGFNPTDKGYTLEFKVSTNNLNKDFTPYAITENGVGFQSLVNSGGMSIFNSVTTSSLATQYNNDKAHTYRYAVTPDRRVFIYRDGIAVDTLRMADYGLQTSFMSEAGDPQENLLKNPGFEGEHNEGGWSADLSMTTAIEGWMISPMDGYNSSQKIVKQEIDNVQDFNNHAVSVNRYKWNDGYGAAEISQIVDVAPNEVYSLSALAKGGIKSDGTKLGAIKVQEVQNSALGVSTPITSAQFQTYSMDYTTSANCKQLKVVLYLERDKWGASISSLVVDNVKLMGKGMTHKQAVGFTNKFSNVEYFTYDVTGAYAPAQPAITPSVSSLALDGTNKSQTFSISPVNLLSDEPITLTAPAGFTVMPTQIPSGSTSADVTVTYTSTLQRMTGDLILRSGDTRVYIPLTGIGTPLVRKNIALNPKFTGTGDVESFSADKAAGFNPTDKGYTLEFKVSTNNLNKDFTPYAITENGVGFQSLVNSGGMSIFNSVTTSSLATQYNNDKAHTYRYAVTPDRRVFIYRDGIAVDTLRMADYGLQTSFMSEAGDPQENLLKNPGFEGEHNEGGWSADLSMTTAIEGWMISPMDGYNSSQKIVKQEIDNVQDFNNHAVSVNRYKWNDGYGAAEISQIVDVAPNEVYSLSALAKGGIKSDGTKLGAIKVQEVQNSALGVSTPITSDQFQTYSMDYTTSASCKQLKVIFYLERDKWGASISNLVSDNVKLMGKGMTHKQAVGFTNKFSNVEYFTYDVTGAYAPFGPSLVSTDVDDLVQKSCRGYVNNDRLYLEGIRQDDVISVYNTMGIKVYQTRDYSAGSGIPLGNRGLYIVVVENKGKKQSLKFLR